jgi:hypothetical protein
MIIAYLLIPTPQINQNAEAAGLNDFQFPTNSKSRAIPILYGTVWTPGNNIFYCCLKSYKIKACS